MISEDIVMSQSVKGYIWQHQRKEINNTITKEIVMMRSVKEKLWHDQLNKVMKQQVKLW